MDGHDGLLGALLGAVVIGSVIGVTSSASAAALPGERRTAARRAVRACAAGLRSTVSLGRRRLLRPPRGLTLPRSCNSWRNCATRAC